MRRVLRVEHLGIYRSPNTHLWGVYAKTERGYVVYEFPLKEDAMRKHDAIVNGGMTVEVRE